MEIERIKQMKRAFEIYGSLATESTIEVLSALEQMNKDIDTLKLLNHELLILSKQSKKDVYKRLSEANETIRRYEKALNHIADKSIFYLRKVALTVLKGEEIDV